MAVKKLENVKKDHEKRMQELQKAQVSDALRKNRNMYSPVLINPDIIFFCYLTDKYLK